MPLASRRLISALLVTLALAAAPIASRSEITAPSHAAQIAAARQLATDIRPLWLEAVIAAEDRNFRKRAPGGSSITAFAARLLLAETESTLTRSKSRARQMQMILSLAASLSGDEIVCIVLQHAYFGRGALGYDTAARTYFAKGANELSLAEMAALTALLNAPEPFAADPARALKRRDFVLKEMLKTGAIGDAALQHALSQPLGFVN